MAHRSVGALTHPSVWERLAAKTEALWSSNVRVAGQLAPALLVTVGLFGGALLLVASSSLEPPMSMAHYGLAYDGLAHAESAGPTFAAYRAIAARSDFAAALFTSFRVATASTIIAIVLGFGLAVLLRDAGARWRTALQASLPLPYIVASLAILWTVSPSGLIARLLVGAGLLEGRAGFPVIVQDPWGIGMIIAYSWKATPFVALIALAALDGLDERLEAAARTLGAGSVLRLRYIVWPHARASVYVAAALVFAFTFGAYEVPLVLGATYPPALPLMAQRLYTHPDISLRPQAFALALVVCAISLGAIALLYGATRFVSHRSAPAGTK